jgi:N-methylhydantoinase B/oxoprolinase/acetone carboxylase alpha subunit
MAELLERAETLTRRAFEQIRPGSYTFEDYLDSDGVVADRLVRIRVTVSVKDSDLHIDFTGSDAQLKGPINADKAAVMSAVYFVAKAIGDPTAPNNGGCYRPIKVHLPEGSVVNPRPPAAVNGRTITMKRIADAILGALVPAMPQRIPAAPSGLVRVLVFGGNDPASGRTFVCTDFSTGGTGGHPEGDGVDSLETDIANTMNMPAESLELHYPLRVHRNALVSDSGGAGAHRGGLGVEREIELLRGEVTLTLREDRHRTKAWGLYGGEPPPFAHAEIHHADGRRTPIPSKGVFRLTAGERIHCWATGGAGYGDPLERDPALVVQDVMDGKVSAEAAVARYGVMGIDAERHACDQANTQTRRAAMREERGPISWTYDRGTRE